MDKRTVVVTGGKRGLVRDLRAFLERGCQVVAVDKDFAGGLARDGEREGLYTYQADISQPLEVASFAQTIRSWAPSTSGEQRRLWDYQTLRSLR